VSDVSFIHREVIFEWDNQKAIVNLRQHDLSFESACEAFFDPFLVVCNAEEVGDELRQKLVGMTRDWRVVLVVYVMRADRVRLISARDATRTERKSYEDQ
jgi:hypothetical protein